jgi:hypothetical protein
VNRVSVKVNRNQLPANLPIDVEHRDLTDRITQILEAARDVQSARKSNRPDIVQKALTQLQKSARPEDIITIKKTLNDIQARVKAAKTIREAQAFTGYVLDKCDVSIRSQVAKVLSVVGMQKCIPSRMAYLYEYVVVD